MIRLNILIYQYDRGTSEDYLLACIPDGQISVYVSRKYDKAFIPSLVGMPFISLDAQNGDQVFVFFEDPRPFTVHQHPVGKNRENNVLMPGGGFQQILPEQGFPSCPDNHPCPNLRGLSEQAAEPFGGNFQFVFPVLSQCITSIAIQVTPVGDTAD